MGRRRVYKGVRCAGWRRNARTGVTYKCLRGATKRGLCDACYERVRSGGEIAKLYRPWQKQMEKRGKK